MNKNTITFVFDDEKDAKQVMDCLSKYIELCWANDTRKAMITTLKNTNTVLVSKSIDEIPKPLRV